jgi:transcriptional regulator with XRE-family HTH domain
MAEDIGSTVPRRQLGRALRELRTEARMTLDGAAKALECSRQKVWRIEAGLSAVRGLDVRAMCALYGATRELTGALTGLAGETRARGWWHAYGDTVPDWFEPYVGLGVRRRPAGNTTTRWCPACSRPELRVAVCQHRSGMTDDEQERLVEGAAATTGPARRRLPPPPQFGVMLSEAVLLRVVGWPGDDGGAAPAPGGDGPSASRLDRVAPLAAGLHFGAVAGSLRAARLSPGTAWSRAVGRLQRVADRRALPRSEGELAPAADLGESRLTGPWTRGSPDT